MTPRVRTMFLESGFQRLFACLLGNKTGPFVETGLHLSLGAFERGHNYLNPLTREIFHTVPFDELPADQDSKRRSLDVHGQLSPVLMMYLHS